MLSEPIALIRKVDYRAVNSSGTISAMELRRWVHFLFIVSALGLRLFGKAVHLA